MRLALSRSLRFAILAGVAALSLGTAGPGYGRTTLLDDSLSPRQQYRLRLEWADIDRLLAGNLETLSDTALQRGFVDHVDVRLDTRAFVGKRARIYLRLPRSTDGAPADSTLSLRWETQGVFNSGEVVPGDRALLYDGPIEQPVMGDIFNFVINYSSVATYGPLQIAPLYEIDTQ